ncbi:MULTISPECIES: hypothetical protein [Thalassospira]|uniref:Uncharacterized protein n=2 Tax=Thalassospira TaxID=168934 RepID=A0A367W121_9PROT|nr:MULTISPECIES: hypothetical protein [Thalassospira]MDG4721752.1 hypothetical protein [Thalassospira sp. FZY0004]RCK31295.1 hypothetical protein TH19_21290 [Thalassospira profundimaris]
MTNSDAPKPDPAKPTATTQDQGTVLPEDGPAMAEKGLSEPTEPGQTSNSEPQDALDLMTALCHEFGFVSSTSSTVPASPATQPARSGETAFDIIARYLFETSGPTRTASPSPNFNDVIPDATTILAQAMRGSPSNSEAPTMNSPFFEASSSSDSTSSAQWGVSITNMDGSTTDLNGAVIADDMFRTAMPKLQGNSAPSPDAGNSTTTTPDAGPDWTITMAQGQPLSPGRTRAQTAIGAQLVAGNVPESLKNWRLHVGPSTDAQSELSVSMPASMPSHLRALMFDCTAKDDAQAQMSEVPVYGGGPYALHLEQSIGSISSSSVPNLALIRLIFADRAPIPVQFEYTGPLPSPVVGGNILTGPSQFIPFRVQITPPSEGDKGASLVVLVRYDQETSFNVTAQLLTEARTCTPTAILTCGGQSDNTTCKAASMVANGNGRLETSLTGLASNPAEADLTEYGFIQPHFPTSDTDDGNSGTAKPKPPLPISTSPSTDNSDSSDSADKSDNPDSPDSTDEADSQTTSAPSTKPAPRQTKTAGNNSSNTNNTKGGT